jgi:hypothetical protein
VKVLRSLFARIARRRIRAIDTQVVVLERLGCADALASLRATRATWVAILDDIERKRAVA